MKFTGDFKRPLSEVQKDRISGGGNSLPPTHGTELIEKVAELEGKVADLASENQDLVTAINQLSGAEEVV